MLSKIKKSKDYVFGAVRNPSLFLYYVQKLLKYRKLGYSDELIFWKREIDKRSPNYSQDMQTKDIMVALNEIKRDFGITGKKVKCLEIGPGPRSRLTKGYDDGLFDLRAVDPLADEFVREFGGRDFLLRGKGEETDKLFQLGSIHMVYASNSIDHGDNPQQTFKAIDAVLKENGILIVCGDIKGADCNNWLGLHQHNLWIDGKDLLWQNRWMKTRNESKIVVNHEDYLCLTQYTAVLDVFGEDVPWFFGMWKKL